MLRLLLGVCWTMIVLCLNTIARGGQVALHGKWNIILKYYNRIFLDLLPKEGPSGDLPHI